MMMLDDFEPVGWKNSETSLDVTPHFPKDLTSEQRERMRQVVIDLIPGFRDFVDNFSKLIISPKED